MGPGATTVRVLRMGGGMGGGMGGRVMAMRSREGGLGGLGMVAWGGDDGYESMGGRGGGMATWGT